MKSEDAAELKKIAYGDVLSYVWMWQKALTLVPLWAVAIIPVVGLIFRGFGGSVLQVGYALTLACCTTYFVEDLLKRRISFDDENIYFGFRVIPIHDIVSIEIGYKRKQLVPRDLVLCCASGRTLKLSLAALGIENVQTLVKHIQSRNSNVKTANVLATLIRCRRISRTPVIETSDKLVLPYNSKQFLRESLDVFRSTASKWIHIGPLIALVICAPMWMNLLSAFYLCLQPNAISNMNMLNLHQFVYDLVAGVGFWISSHGEQVAKPVADAAQDPVMASLVISLLAGLFLCFAKFFLLPNRIETDDSGIKLKMGVGDFVLPMAQVPWSQIENVSLFKPAGGAGSQMWKLRLGKTNGRKVDLQLAAIAPEDRPRLLRRIQKHLPSCEIGTELSQSMLPKANHSYTEIWLQSLTQAPQRKTLEPLEPGSLVGEDRFRVVKKLGVGGQGTAYLCKVEHEAKSTVVLKEMILPVFVEDSIRREALARFEAEARLLKSLNSNRIVKLVDYFIEDHRSYLVLEHIDGPSLREIIAREGPMSEERARDLAEQMCAILDILHSNSIVHRDFTPDNLLLTEEGILKLIDFNVAQQSKSGTTGTIVGKHAYLPPEQLRGKATEQSDLYAMGATLFYLLTGKDPEPISQSSPRALVSGVSESLDALVKTATSLQCEKRFASAAEILEALQAESDGGESAAVISSVKLREAEAIPNG